MMQGLGPSGREAQGALQDLVRLERDEEEEGLDDLRSMRCMPAPPPMLTPPLRFQEVLRRQQEELQQ